MKPTTLPLLLSILAPSLGFCQVASAPGGPSDQDDVKLDSSFIHFFRPIIGAGFNWRIDDIIDFKVDDASKRLLTENDSSFRVAGTVGFFIPWSSCGVKWEHWLYDDKVEKTAGDAGDSPKLPACYVGTGVKTKKNGKTFDDREGRRALFRHWRMRSGFMANLQLNQGASNTAFSLGYGFMIRPGVILQASYTRSLGKELSAGFQRSAAQAVKDNPNEDAFKRWQGAFLPNGTDLTDPKNWDGFPLAYGTPSKSVFPGNPIIDSYNGSVTMGIAIPLDRILRVGDK